MCIVDASNLERNLYLVSQTLELGRPVVLALNKMDLATERRSGSESRTVARALGRSRRSPAGPSRNRVEELKHELQKAVGAEPPSSRHAVSATCSTNKSRRWRGRQVEAERRRCRGTWSNACCWTSAATWSRPSRRSRTRRCWPRSRPPANGWLEAGYAGAGGRDDGPLRLGRRRAGRRP